MYQNFQKLVGIYETEPDNFPRMLELMQDLQECGHPPQEIIKELAPGLEVSPDGLPMMPNMGPGVPDVPGMAGMPGGACTIM
jgi:peroxin-19